MDAEDFARICLDPVRLAALGRGVEGSLTVDSLSNALGITSREALETIGNLRVAKLIDGDGNLVMETLHEIASTLSKPLAASAEITAGDWSEPETKILETFFTGDRLREIPTQHAKRRVVLERLAQEFEPGARYDEGTVSERLAAYHDDYAALRRYLVDEGILTRAEGMYWRSGGRIPLDTKESAESTLKADGESLITLETERLDVTLTPFDGTSPRELANVANDERIARFMADSFPYPYTVDDAADWIDKVRNEDPPHHFAVFTDGVLVGGVGCVPNRGINAGSGEIGWWLNPEWWGRGIATAAVKRFIEYCFDELDLHRVEAGVFRTNPASARVADKCGMVLEGISRDAYCKAGSCIDRLSYGLARSEHDRTR